MKSIYLVEDNPEISELIGYLLTDLGHEVESDATVSSFRQRLANALPDLVILDIMLCDGDGLDVCRELKSDPATQHIPVILMSAHVNVREKALEAAADDFISKPFDINDFTKQVQHLLD